MYNATRYDVAFFGFLILSDTPNAVFSIIYIVLALISAVQIYRVEIEQESKND